MSKNKQSNELRTVFIPKTEKHDDSLYIAVNGQRLLVKKGESVLLPVKFAEVIENSFAASRQAEKYIDTVSKETAE